MIHSGAGEQMVAGRRLFLAALISVVVAGHSHGVRGHRHDYGEVVVPLGCKNPVGSWDSGPLAVGPGSDPACLAESL